MTNCQTANQTAEMPSPFYVQNSAIHGKGLFAARPITKGEHIGNYEGQTTHHDGMYVLWVEDDEGKSFGIDGKNELRYVNHSGKPNAVFYGEELIALNPIAPNDEITFHYGEDWQ